MGLSPVFCVGDPVNRVVFLVDGFNVYHSLRQATRDSGETLKWLDLHALCNSYVQSSLFGEAGVLERDLLPAIAAARRLSSGRAIWIGFPYKRLNQELRLVADGHFRIRRQAYARHQLPDPLKLPDEAMVRKPAGW